MYDLLPTICTRAYPKNYLSITKAEIFISKFAEASRKPCTSAEFENTKLGVTGE